jgi:uncharacterized LabA/DUF88 family protein
MVIDRGTNVPFVIVIDGPNFINELHEHGKGRDFIMNKLSFPVLHNLIQRKLRENGLYSHPFFHTEFICSNIPRIGSFRGDDYTKLMKKLMNETGVSVRKVDLSSKGEHEKGVDMTVFATMIERGGNYTHVVLIGADRDYVPALNALTKRNVHTIVVGFKDGKFIDLLINESYLFLDLKELLDEMEEITKENKRESIESQRSTDQQTSQSGDSGI